MKILFTGNRGNLGKELIPLLEEDHSVQCYDIDYSNFDNVNSFFRHREIDFIIHAAIRVVVVFVLTSLMTSTTIWPCLKIWQHKIFR